MNTDKHFQLTNGRIEARLRFSAGSGIWPAPADQKENISAIKRI